MATPLYTVDRLQAPAYHLRYSWCGWFASPQTEDRSIWRQLDEAWEQDGLRRLESAWLPDRLHVTFSAKPEVSPVVLAQRAKGRLQYPFRPRVQFSRKLSVRSLGDNRCSHVAAYIAKQVAKAEFVDAGFAAALSKLTQVGSIDFSAPVESRSGRYWHNLHVVLVCDSRLSTSDLKSLSKIFEGCERIAKKKGHLLHARAVLPDHIHLSVRPLATDSPESVALAYLNNLAYRLGQQRWWMPSYYAGTFGEYDMGAVRP